MRLSVAALIFYVIVFILWTLNIIPAPAEIFIFLESVFNSIGLTGVFLAILLESIVFVGLYFPGSFILAIAIFLSDGTFTEFLLITLITTLALTIGSIINYNLGKYKLIDVSFPAMPSKFFFLFTFLHPNFMAFYFYSQGLMKQNFSKIIYVPLFIIPYGLFLSFLIFSIKEQFKTAIESPFLIITILIIWTLSSILITKLKKAPLIKPE